MIACSSFDWLDLATKIGILLLGTAIGWSLERFRSREKLINEVAERYVAERRIPEFTPYFENTFCKRFGSMQRAGLGLLKNDRQIKEFRRIVIGRGCADPFFDSELGIFLKKKNGLTKFLNAASARGISLVTDTALSTELLHALIKAEEHETKT